MCQDQIWVFGALPDTWNVDFGHVVALYLVTSMELVYEFHEWSGDFVLLTEIG